MWFGKTDERDGTFVISNPDLNAYCDCRSQTHPRIVALSLALVWRLLRRPCATP